MPATNAGSSNNGLQLSSNQQEFTFKSNQLTLSVPGGPTFVLPPGFVLPPDVTAKLQQAEVAGQASTQGPPSTGSGQSGNGVAVGGGPLGILGPNGPQNPGLVPGNGGVGQNEPGAIQTFPGSGLIGHGPLQHPLQPSV